MILSREEKKKSSEASPTERGLGGELYRGTWNVAYPGRNRGEGGERKKEGMQEVSEGSVIKKATDLGRKAPCFSIPATVRQERPGLGGEFESKDETRRSLDGTHKKSRPLF